MKTRTLVAPKKLRSPLKWHGGKSYLARRIIALFPPHEVYVEPFFGGSVLLNKARAGIETVGDLDERLMLFWSVLGDDERFGRFFDRVSTTPYEAPYFALAKAYVLAPPWPLDEIDRAEYAAMFLRWNRMSRAGSARTSPGPTASAARPSPAGRYPATPTPGGRCPRSCSRHTRGSRASASSRGPRSS